MVLFNYSTKELTAKVVYYGPGLCGKTTNLQWIHEKLPIKNKGKMLSLATETDRTLFFDFLPIELGTIRGMKTRIQLYTVPGQVFYNATRRMVLKGADCVVFVCDSQEPMIEANLESFENLRQNLEANEIDPNEVPLVLQYNKRDLPNALPLEILNERLNPRGVPFYEAVAVKGQGVEETLKGVTGLVFKSLADKYGGLEAARPAPAPAAAPPPAAKPATATLPPLNITKTVPRPEVLDSLELEPAPEIEEFPLDEPELALPTTEPPDTDLPVEDVEELSFDTPPPSPRNPKDTLVSSEKESEDLRRRISRPSLPDVSLEEIEEEEANVAEISLDSEESPPSSSWVSGASSSAEPEVFEAEELVTEVPPAPPPAPPPPPTQVQTLPPGARPTPPPSRPSPPPAAPPPRAVPRPEPAAAPLAGRAPAATAVATPVVSVELHGSQRDVAIPVEVTLESGTAHVTIHLRLSLKLQLDR